MREARVGELRPGGLEPLALVINLRMIIEQQHTARTMALDDQFGGRFDILQVDREPTWRHLVEDGQRLLERPIGLKGNRYRPIVDRGKIDRRKVHAAKGKKAEKLIGSQQLIRIIVPEGRKSTRPVP